jgi:hypothetical protein
MVRRNVPPWLDETIPQWPHWLTLQLLACAPTSPAGRKVETFKADQKKVGMRDEPHCAHPWVKILQWGGICCSTKMLEGLSFKAWEGVLHVVNGL